MPVRISPELRARIDALPSEGLKAEILELLEVPREHRPPDERIFDNIVGRHREAAAYRARLRQWQDSEVLAFIAYFKEKMPEAYEEYLRQEREHNEIEAELAWKIYRLAMAWMPDLGASDDAELFVHVRHHARAHLI